jgi:type IV pilus assembly protein PilZ
MSDEDKREHPRIPVSLRVVYLNRGELARDLVTDLSPGGLYLRTTRPLEIGTEVDLEVLVTDEDLPIHVRGKVVWLRKPPAAHEGMGIQFTGVMGPVLLELVAAAKKG